jgi:hypothetical protein
VEEGGDLAAARGCSRADEHRHAALAVAGEKRFASQIVL